MAERAPIDPDRLKLSHDLVVQTESWLRHHNFLPVRVDLRGKNVARIDAEYGSLKWRAPTAADFHAGNWSIGCILGPARRGPVDVDLDCAEAIFFGNKFLPPTRAIFGRPSRPRSHWFYVVKESELPSIQIADPARKEKTMMVELRADTSPGAQPHHTVMPGSIHVSDEIVEWSTGLAFPDPAEVLGEDLATVVRKIAMAVLIVRYLWPEGERHHNALALAGMLYHYRWTIGEAEEFLSAIMEYMGDTDKSRIGGLRSTYAKGEAGKKIVGATTLRKKKQYTVVVDRLLDLLGPSTSSVVAEMNEQFACLSLDGKFRVARADARPGERPTLMGKEDFLDMYSNSFVPNVDGKIVSKVRLWLGAPDRRFCPRVEFLPGVAEDDLEPGVFNMWTGWSVDPDPSASCEAWLELVYDIICGKDDRIYDWFMNWLAHMFQYPTIKAHTCPVIIGVPGAGKTLMCTYLSRVLGAAYLQVTKPEHIQGRFNAHLRYTLLLHSDEALYARDKKHRAVIKSLVTDERQMNEQKGVDATFVRSYLRLLLTSNYEHAAPAEEKDRRFTIINMLRDQRKVSTKNKDRVVAEMNGSGPAALLHTLLTMPVNLEMANHNIKNEDWAQNVLDHTDPVVGWWHERLQTGLLVPENLRWATRPSGENWPRKVGLEALYRYFVEDMRTSSRQYGIMGRTAFTTKLNDLTGGVRKKHMIQYYPPIDEDFPRWVRELPGAQKSILDMPSLDNCRFAFERFMGHSIAWESTAIAMVPEDDTEGAVPPAGH